MNQIQPMPMNNSAVSQRGPANLKTLLADPAIRSRFEEMLGKRAPSFLSSILSSVSSNQTLASCEPMSVISAAAIAASMDLPINSSLGFAHIVPYKGVAQFQIGWKGFVQLAMRSGQYKTINITPVLEGQIKGHNPFTGEMEFSVESTSDKQVGYLLYFKLLNGYEKYYYMTREKVLAHGQEYSASFKKGFGMWVDDFEAMALKTVAKLGLSKYGILSVDMQKAVEFDQAAIGEDGEPQYVDSEVRKQTEPARIQATIPKATSAKAEDMSQAQKEAPRQESVTPNQTGTTTVPSATATTTPEAATTEDSNPEPGTFGAFQAGPPPGATESEVPASMTKSKLAVLIKDMGVKLGLDMHAIDKRCRDEYEKGTAQMTRAEMWHLAQALDAEIAKKASA